MEHIIKQYENYSEEDRLTTNNARKIEFLTNVKALDKVIPDNSKILDCGAGTGIYSFYFAKKNHDVIAIDITPKHIEYIEKEAKNKSIKLSAKVSDATDLSAYKDSAFDIVLCMGPMYHLTDVNMRNKCLSECIRVLKKHGILVVSYINRFFIFPRLVSNKSKFINLTLAKQLVETGTITHDDLNSFWTDAYLSTPDDMEDYFHKFNLKILDHIASDGISPLISDKIDSLNEEEFKVWCDYHSMTCREKSILGISNHGLIIGEVI